MKRTFLVGSQRLLEPLLGDPAEFQLWTARATVDCGLSQRRQQNARPLKLYSIRPGTNTRGCKVSTP